MIVNRSFVERVMGERNPVGRRLRYVQAGNSGSEVAPSPWHEIVGVVRDLGMGVEPDPPPSRPGSSGSCPSSWWFEGVIAMGAVPARRS